VGLGAPAEQARVGHGLRNIAERIEAIGGALAFPACDKGTRVRMTMPLVTPPVLGMPATADAP
jgi:signal transduction histidine kinase